MRVHTYNWIGDSPFDGAGQCDHFRFAAPSPATFLLPQPVQITSLLLTNHDALITWSTFGNATNVVEAAAKLDGIFSEVSPRIFIEGSGPTATNYLDVGALTNSASRFYRIRLIP